MSVRAILGSVMLLALASSAVPATSPASIDVVLQYPAEALAIGQGKGCSDVQLPGSERLPRPGAPALPMRAEQVVLPAGMLARSARAVSRAAVRIPCGFVRPFQPPTILGGSPAPVSPDAAIYQGGQLYPPDLVVFRGTGKMGGLRIAACEIHPVQYDPATQEIVLHTEIRLTLQLEADASYRPPPAGPAEPALRLARAGMHGAPDRAGMAEAGRARALDRSHAQYVIITNSAQYGTYQPYAAWKTAKGVPALVVTVEWIAGTYPGRDLAEQIRNFIIDAVDQWGTAYVLLGGDTAVVPTRVAWAFDCAAGAFPDENDLHADLYYADLDGSWDENGNGVFGEVDDEVDLYPDVLVGRAPSESPTEAAALVNKFLMYERTAPAGHTREAFFFAEILWSDPYTDSSIGKEMIGERHFAGYEPIERQYESLGNESDASVIAYLNGGPHLTNHAGHAFHDVLSTGTGSINLNEASALTNAPHFFVLYSIGCWAGALDYDCVGERLAANAHGGTIAFVGNCRYGWGSPGNPGWGYSETFDRDFYGAILTEGLTQFGAAVSWPKIRRIPYAQDGNVYRWHEYQVNLLGDPEMACHTAEIRPLSLAAPTAIPLGVTQFTATATDADGPVAGARVCLSGTDVYAVGTTDAGGQVVFETDLAGGQTLRLVATAPNHPFAERAIVAAGDDAFLTVAGVAIDDAAGNGDGEIGAGETIGLFVTLHNYGGEDARNVSGTLSENSPYATLINATADYGTVSAGGEATNAAPFTFAVHPECPADASLAFSLRVEDEAQESWVLPVPLTVVAPGPRFARYAIHELSGDGDGTADPGERLALTVTVRNDGSGNVGPLQAVLTTGDANLSVVQSAAETDTPLEPGDLALLEPPFEVLISPDCPATTYGKLDLALLHSEGAAVDSFLLAVGRPGFCDDMEAGADGWTHFGTNDLWRLTTHRSHSSSHSWYCGTAGHTYVNNTHAQLVSPPFVVPADAELAFWCYFDVTVYGVDGLFVEVWHDDRWETLTYLGSGGALGDSLLFLCDWTASVFPLQDLTPGSTSQVRFRFVSDDSDVAEGFYIDDVCIRSAGASGLDTSPVAGALSLAPSGAQPVLGTGRWRLRLAAPTHVAAAIYDPAGRRVEEIRRGAFPAGVHELAWEAATVPDGVYFLRVTAGSRMVTRQVVKLSP